MVSIGINDEKSDSSQTGTQHSEIILERTLAIFKKEAWKKEVPLLDILMKAGIAVTNVSEIKWSTITIFLEKIY